MGGKRARTNSLARSVLRSSKSNGEIMMQSVPLYGAGCLLTVMIIESIDVVGGWLMAMVDSNKNCCDG